VVRFPLRRQPLPMAGIYLRSIVEMYRLDHDPRWYRVAAGAAQQMPATTARPGRLQTSAARTSLRAWAALAVVARLHTVS
jgi:hypothetical protein